MTETKKQGRLRNYFTHEENVLNSLAHAVRLWRMADGEQRRARAAMLAAGQPREPKAVTTVYVERELETVD